MKNALVTGAAGFIGTRLCALLRDAAWGVRATDAYAVDGEAPCVQAHLGQGAFPPEIAAGVDTVFHVAMCRAMGRRAPSGSIPLPLLRLAARASDGIGALRGRRFVFDSSALDKLIGSEEYSNARIRAELGFRPEWTLEKALPEMVTGR